MPSGTSSPRRWTRLVFAFPLRFPDQRPADIFISRPVAVDVSVVHPLGAAQHHGPAVAGAAAEDREKAKLTQYGRDCSSAGWDFVPLVAECTGAWGHRAQSFISSLIRKQARATGEKVATVSSAVWGELSFALARASASMLVQANQRALVEDAPKPALALPRPLPACAVPLSSASGKGDAGEQQGSMAVEPRAAQSAAAAAMAVMANDGETVMGPLPIMVSVRLPSGSTLPMRGDPAEPLRLWKERVLRHCGFPPSADASFGLASGRVALDEAQTAAFNDVHAGDTLLLFQRGGDAAAAVLAREEAAAGL